MIDSKGNALLFKLDCILKLGIIIIIITATPYFLWLKYGRQTKSLLQISLVKVTWLKSLSLLNTKRMSTIPIKIPIMLIPTPQTLEDNTEGSFSF